MSEWYEELKPGDKVGIVNSNSTSVKIVEVDRLTPSGQIIVGDRRFKKRKYGNRIEEMGEKYYTDRLVSHKEAQERLEEIHQANLKAKLTNTLHYNTGWNKFTIEQLQQVIQLVESFKVQQ